jgi:pilus assembly protein CpaF
VVQLGRLPDGNRKIVSISEITGMEGDVITMQDLFVFERQGLEEDGRVIGRFRSTGIRPKFTDLLKGRGIEFDSAIFLDVEGS